MSWMCSYRATYPFRGKQWIRRSILITPHLSITETPTRKILGIESNSTSALLPEMQIAMQKQTKNKYTGRYQRNMTPNPTVIDLNESMLNDKLHNKLTEWLWKCYRKIKEDTNYFLEEQWDHDILYIIRHLMNIWQNISIKVHNR